MWRFCTGSGLSALWRAGSGVPMDPGTSKAVPLPRAPTQVPWRRSACPTPTFPEAGPCLPPPRPNPKARGRPVRAPSAMGESGWASQGDRASQICTRATGTRVRHFGARHRISYSSIRCLWGACRHGPHGEVGGVPIPVLGWSRQSLYGSGCGRVPSRPAFWRGWYPANTVVSIEDARAGGARWGGVAARRHWARALPRSGSAGTKGGFSARFLSPGTNNALPRAAFCRLWSPSCRPSARGRRGGPRRDDKRAPWTPRGRRAGRPSVQQTRTTAMGCAAAQGTCAAGSALARPWGRAFLACVGQARPPRTPSPRPADASRPASIAGGAAELALVCDEGQGTLPGSARRVARVAHAETARVRPGAEPLPCVSPRRRVADLQAVSRLCPTPNTHVPLTGYGSHMICSRVLCRVR